MAWAPLVGRLAHLGRAPIGILRDLRIVLHRGRQLLHAAGRFFEAACLLFGALGQRTVALGQTLASLAHERGIAADVGHHGRKRTHHALQQLRQCACFIPPTGIRTHRQIPLHCALQGTRQRGEIARKTQVQSHKPIQPQHSPGKQAPPAQAQNGERHAREPSPARYKQFPRQMQTAHEPQPRSKQKISWHDVS